MKKLLTLLCALAFILSFATIFACSSTPNEPALPEITGVTFASAEYDYDGTEKSITAENIPDGISAVYSNNVGTNAGTYNASVTLSGEGYKTTVLRATLTINKLNLSGISLEQDVAITVDGQYHFPTIIGTIPNGATKEWKFNNTVKPDGVKDVGVYNVQLTIKYPNYNDLVLTTTYTISDLPAVIGVSFVNSTVDYNGSQQSLIATNLPQGVSAVYSNNVGTNAGTYNASVTLSGEGYKTTILYATLTINKIDLLNVSLEENGKVTHDGNKHLPEIIGDLPITAIKEWSINGIKNSEGVDEIGSYTVSLKITDINYNDLVLTTTFNIKRNLLGFAKAILDCFGETPTPWSFLPESLGVNTKLVDNANIPDYVNFTQISSIPTNYIGAQLNVVFGVLNTCETALKYIQPVYSAFNIVQSLYQTFLDSDPTDYKTYSGNTGAFNFSITIGDNYYNLVASINSVEVSIFSDQTNKTYGARVQLTETTVLKYTVSDTNIIIALNVLNKSTTQIEFVRNTNNPNLVTGYVYEYLGVAGIDLVSTSALINVGEDYTTIIGTKGDFIPTAESRNCEVYDNTTGKLVGTEVREDLDGKKTYDTLWYNLCDVQGIYNIRMEDDYNFSNPFTVYINDKTDTLHSKNVYLFIDASRRFDIEFKQVFAYTYDSEKDEYNKVDFLVPMMFVQETMLSTFETDFEDENDVAVTLNVSANDKEAVRYGYHELVDVYDTIKELLTQEKVIAYCSSKH